MHPPQPEMSNNVQKYDKKVYLRVSEAQRCRVNSTMVLPLYSPDMMHKPVAVFELVQSGKDCPFSMILSKLRKCLEVGGFSLRWGESPECWRKLLGID